MREEKEKERVSIIAGVNKFAPSVEAGLGWEGEEEGGKERRRVARRGGGCGREIRVYCWG